MFKRVVCLIFRDVFTYSLFSLFFVHPYLVKFFHTKSYFNVVRLLHVVRSLFLQNIDMLIGIFEDLVLLFLIELVQTMLTFLKSVCKGCYSILDLMRSCTSLQISSCSLLIHNLLSTFQDLSFIA